MRYVKALGLAVIAASALLALLGTGSASATQLTCQPGVVCPVSTQIHSEAEEPIVLHPPIGSITCQKATGDGKLENAGSSTTTPSGTPALTTISECNATVTVLQKGTLEVHTKNAGADNNGTFTSKGTRVTVVYLGFHCIFETSPTTGTDIGTLTGSSTTGGTATLDTAATIPRVGGNSGAFCGSTAQFTGTVRVTKPDWLDID